MPTIDFRTAGLVTAGAVAAAAFLLKGWEERRPRWSRPVPMDALSDRVRRAGIVLLWVEAFLMAVGSLLPTKIRQDVLLFVSIWGVVGVLAVLLVGLTIADALIRSIARRQRAAGLHRDITTLLRPPRSFEPGDDQEEDDTDDSH